MAMGNFGSSNKMVQGTFILLQLGLFLGKWFHLLGLEITQNTNHSESWSVEEIGLGCWTYWRTRITKMILREGDHSIYGKVGFMSLNLVFLGYCLWDFDSTYAFVCFYYSTILGSLLCLGDFWFVIIYNLGVCFCELGLGWVCELLSLI